MAVSPGRSNCACIAVSARNVTVTVSGADTVSPRAARCFTSARVEASVAVATPPTSAAPMSIQLAPVTTTPLSKLYVPLRKRRETISPGRGSPAVLRSVTVMRAVCRPSASSVVGAAARLGCAGVMKVTLVRVRAAP